MNPNSNVASRLRIMPIEDRSAIGICVCKGCGSRYEPKPHQSLTRCEYCQPLTTPECVHAVSLHEPCQDCHKIYGRAYMRQLPQAPKTPIAKPLVRGKRMSMSQRRIMSRR